MRTKDEILKDSNDHLRKAPDWDGTASLHERLTIEVLIDIRDILKEGFDDSHYEVQHSAPKD